jgi:hypothetical protein
VGHGRQLVGTTMNQGGLGEKETPAYLCGAGGGGFWGRENIRGCLGELLDFGLAQFSRKTILGARLAFSWRCS